MTKAKREKGSAKGAARAAMMAKTMVSAKITGLAKGAAAKNLAVEDHVDLRQAQWARELPGLDTEPMAILGRANRIASLVRPSIEKTFAGFGLDRGEFDVIATLRRSGPPYRLIPTELYTSLMLSSGGLTHRLDRLEKRGLIARERSAKDGRSLPVALTPAGAALAEKAFRADMASELTFLKGLDADERKTLADLLKKLVMSIEQRGGE